MATDAATKTTTVTRTVVIDKTIPVATVAAVGGYNSGTIAISGTATDANIDFVEYQLGSTAGAWTSSSGTLAWTGSLDLSAAAEGSILLYVRSTDKAGNVSTIVNTAVNVDRANPRATANYTATLIQTRNDIAFSGSADDASITAGRAATTAVLTYSKDGAAAVTVAAGVGVNQFNWNSVAGTWAWTMPVALGDGLYAITLTVTDVAGKVSTVSRTVQIDLTAPTITIGAPGSGASSTTNSIAISGTSRDTGGVGFAASANIDAEYSLNSTNGTDGLWTTLGSLDATINWSASGVSLGAVEGAKKLYLRSTDKVGNIGYAFVDFYYDISAPTLTETTVNTTDTQYRRTDLTLGGKASDTNALTGLTVSVNGGGTVAIPVDADGADNIAGNGDDNSWTYSFDVDAPIDGTYTLSFVATDAATKTTTLTRTVIVDKTQPIVSVTPVAGWNSGIVNIGGTSAETYMSLVEYQLGTGSWAPASGTLNWTGSLNLASAAEGTVALNVRGTDRAGNVGTATTNIQVDLAAPALTETTVNTTDSQYRTTDLTLGGFASDSNALTSLTVSINGGAAGAITVDADGVDNIPGNGDDNSWSYIFDVNSPIDGTYTLVFTATDVATKTTSLTRTVVVDNALPTVTITPVVGYQSATVAIDGTASDTNLTRVEYQLGAVTEGFWTTASGTASWTGAVNVSAVAEGSRTLYYRAFDRAGNVSATGNTTIFVDRANPRATEINYTATLYQTRTDVVFSGTADDASITAGRAATTAVLTYSKDGAAAVTVAAGVGVNQFNWNSVAGTWTWTMPTTLGDGLYAIILTVTDQANKVSTVSRSVQFDLTAPTIVIGAPGSGASSTTATYTISGTSRDTGGTGFAASANTDAEYSLDSTNGVNGTWTALGSLDATINWSAAGVVLGAEGAKLLYVRSTDKVGNIGTAFVNFYYDIAPPTLTETTVNTTDTQYRRTDLVLGGKASDTNALTSLTVSVNGGGTTAIIPNGTNDWTYTFDVASRSDGVYNLSFVATDAATKTTTVTRTVQVDKTLPFITIVTNLTGWKGTPSLSVTGTASDTGGSGVNLVEYTLDGGTSWNALSGTTGWSGIVPVIDGTNVVSFRSRDTAGNYSATNTNNVTVDLTNPDITVTTPASLVRVNGTAILSTVFAATDIGGSGLSSVLITRIGAIDIADITATLATGTIYNGTWNASIPAATLLALTNGTQYSVYVQATDVVGKTTTVSFPILVDKQVPTVGFTLPLASSTTNKLIDVTGTGGDDQSLSTVVVSIEHSDLATWTPLQTFNGTSGFAWTISAFNTETWGVAAYDTSGTAGIQLSLRAVATDAAGNSTTSYRTFTVDQDSDRPVVKLTNINTNGTTILKMTDTVYGTVSDDDGPVTLFRVSENGTVWENVTLDGGTWSRDASAGDGAKLLYFEVTDASGTVFTTDLSDEPKIQYGMTIYNSFVAYRVDTVTPELRSDIFVDRATPFDFASPDLLVNNMPFGGTTAQFAVSVSVTDANGIGSVTVAIPGVTGSPFAMTGSFTNAPVLSASEIKKGGEYRISTIDTTNFMTAFGASANIVGTQFTATRDGTGLDTGTVLIRAYSTGTIDVSSGVADGYVALTVEATDNSGLRATATRTIQLDNTAPTVTHQSPLLGATVNGEIEVKGLTDDGLGSGIKSLQYKIGYNHALESWQNVTAGTLSWRIDFKGVNKIDIYANAGDGILGTGLDAGLWTVPILMRVEDNAGNVRIYDQTTYTLKVDPSGDKPKVAVVYPSPIETNRVMGGIIRIFGTSEDDDGVASVWMQIDTNNDGNFDAADVAGGTDWYNGGDGQLVSGTISWNKSINTTNEFNPTGAAINATGIRNGVRYKIITQGSTDYISSFGSLSNSVNTEFTASRDANAGDGNGTVEPLITRINFRVRARDINATPVDGSWSVAYVIDVDKNVPKIGSATALHLTQGATDIPYVADMWVKGNWTLGGSVEDESGISEIVVSGDINGTLSSGLHPTWFVQGPDLGGGKYNYTLAIPVTTGAGTSGPISVSIKATDNNTPNLDNTASVAFNYDNANPVVAALTSSGAEITNVNPVVQSNNIYTIASSVTEAGSGFSRVAFYFERNVVIDANDRVYNPMVTKDGNANRTLLSALAMVDGLPRLQLTGATRTAYTLTHASLVGNTNVRKGSLVKIGGVDRLITAFNSGTGTITWADSVDVSILTADVAYALIVDNMTIESPVWVGDTLSSITNDDGDGLIETVERTGGTYNWTASLDSRNIPDGPIEIHYVAYDKAGNYITGTTLTSVQNNRPMLAAVILGTDLDGNGNVSTAERVPAYSALDGLGKKQAVATVVSGAFTAKGLTSVDIDVVGGNGQLQYVFTVGGTTIHSLTSLRSGTEHVATAIDTGTNIITSAGHGFVDGNIVYLDATVLPTETGSVVLPKGNYYIRDMVGNTFRIAKTYNGPAVDLTSAGTSVRFSLLSTILISQANLVLPAIGEGSKNFVFTIWDSTDETTPGTDSQWAQLTVPLIVDAVDGVSPKSVISPFFWNTSGDNSLYLNSKSNGHIENPGVIGGADPDVSGQISVRGTAYDDQRLSSIWMYIDGYTFTGATTRTTFDTNADGSAETLTHLYAQVATYSSATGLWTGTDQWIPAGWRFTVSPDYLDQTGHKVNWQLDFDTSFVTGRAALDRYIRVLAEDKRTAPNASSEALNATADITTNNVPYYQMDVVPYISSIETELGNSNPLNRSISARSATGKYSVWRKQLTNAPTWQSEQIRVKGFNLTPTAANRFTLSKDTDGLNAGRTAYDGTAVQILNANVTQVVDKKEYLVSLADITASGYLNMAIVSGSDFIPTTNNVNDDEAKGSYAGSLASNYCNREPNAINNDVLTDNRWIDLWQTTATTNTGDIRMVDMEVSGNNLNFGAGRADDRYAIFPALASMTATWTDIRSSYTRYFDNKIAYNQDGTTPTVYSVSQCGDTLGVPVNGFTLPSHFGFVLGTPNGTGNIEYSNAAGSGRLFLESNWNGSDLNKLDRVQWPDMKVRGNNTTSHVYLSYYDATQKLLKFRYFQVGPSGQTAGLSTATLLTAGTVLTTMIPYTSANGGNGTVQWSNMEEAVSIYTNGSVWRQGFTAIAGANANSPYSAVAFTNAGTAIVAWYDAPSSSLKLKYNTTPATAFSGYQAFNSQATNAPAVGTGTYNFKLSVDGVAQNGGNDISVTFAASTNGNLQHEFAYQLNKVLSENYNCYAEVDPVTSRVTVKSFQTGAASAIAITAGAAPNLLGTLNVQAAVAGYGTAWVERTIDSDSAGKYVSMTVDANSGIHIAYQQTTSADLRYAYLSDPTAAPVVITVDSYGQVGQFTDITTRVEDINGDADTEIIPYITYYNMSSADTKYSVKMARLNVDAINTVAETVVLNATDHQGVVDEKFTGMWEVMTVPAREVPKQYRVNVGIKTNGDLFVGYQGDNIEYARYVP